MGCFGQSRVGPVDGGDVRKEPLQGPYAKRHTTDCVWLIIFFAFMLGMVAIASVAIGRGEPERLIYGHDSFGNICGQENPIRAINNTNSGLDMTNRKYVLYFDPGTDGALQLCVPACSDTGSTALAQQLCLSSSPYTNSTVEVARGHNIDVNGCPSPVIDTAPFIHRCVPTIGSVSAVFDAINSDGTFTTILSDLTATWREVLYLCVVALVISFIMVVMLKMFAWILIWTTYYVAFLSTAVFIIYMWWSYKRFNDEYQETPEAERLESQKENVQWYFYGAIVVSIVGGVILLVLLVLRKRLALVIALFQEAGRALRRMPLLLFFPLVSFVWALLIVAYFFGVYLYLYTVSVTEEDEFDHVQYTSDRTLVYMQWYHIFGFLWAYQLVKAVQECTVAGAVASWYFLPKSLSLSSPISKSYWRSLRYHLGSLAFGAAIIAFVQLLRLILAYIQKKTKGRLGALADVVLRCCACCLWCMEKCLKFLNRNAYIEIAIYGFSFCKAARTAFSLLLRNALRVAVINSVGDFVIFLSRLVIVGLTGTAALIWFRELSKTDVEYPAVPVIIVCICAFIISGIFMSIYEMAVDTLFVCFAEDSERNDGSPAKPFHMSDNLAKFMSSAARREKKLTEKAAAATATTN